MSVTNPYKFWQAVFSKQVFSSVSPQPAFVISQFRQVACSWWKPYSPCLLENSSPPPARLLRQGKGPLNYVEVNSRQWQRDMVAGAPNGPLWRNSEFMRRRVSYLVDSSRGVLPCEPFDSPYVRGTSDLPPGPQPSTVRRRQNYGKQIAGVCGFCFQASLMSCSCDDGGTNRFGMFSVVWHSVDFRRLSLPCMWILKRSILRWAVTRHVWRQ